MCRYTCACFDSLCYELHLFLSLNRRQQLRDVLRGTPVVPITCTAFPRLGCYGFIEPAYEPTPESGVSHSLFFPDEAIWQGHPRFR